MALQPLPLRGSPFIVNFGGANTNTMLKHLGVSRAAGGEEHPNESGVGMSDSEWGTRDLSTLVEMTNWWLWFAEVGED